MKRAFYALAGFTALLAAGLFLLGYGYLGRHEGPGQVTDRPLPAATLKATEARSIQAAHRVGAPLAHQNRFSWFLHGFWTHFGCHFPRTLRVKIKAGIDVEKVRKVDAKTKQKSMTHINLAASNAP